MHLRARQRNAISLFGRASERVHSLPTRECGLEEDDVSLHRLWTTRFRAVKGTNWCCVVLLNNLVSSFRQPLARGPFNLAVGL